MKLRWVDRCTVPEALLAVAWEVGCWHDQGECVWREGRPWE